MNDDAPLGSWTRVYGFVLAAALVVMAVLYWFTSTWNIPLGAP